MPIAVRFDPDLERKLRLFSKRSSRTQSDVIKASLREYLLHHEERKNPYYLGHDLFGKVGSSGGNLSTTPKSLLRKKIREKNIGR